MMSRTVGLAGSLAGFVEVLLMSNELSPRRQQRARELLREFNKRTGFPALNDARHLQDNVSEAGHDDLIAVVGREIAVPQPDRGTVAFASIVGARP